MPGASTIMSRLSLSLLLWLLQEVHVLHVLGAAADVRHTCLCCADSFLLASDIHGHIHCQHATSYCGDCWPPLLKAQVDEGKLPYCPDCQRVFEREEMPLIEDKMQAMAIKDWVGGPQIEDKMQAMAIKDWVGGPQIEDKMQAMAIKFWVGGGFVQLQSVSTG